MNSSGNIRDGFITPIIEGPEWLTGGAFGIEASFFGILIQVIVGILLLVLLETNLDLKPNKLIKEKNVREE